MKKILCAILAALMLLNLVACGAAPAAKEQEPQAAQAQQQEPQKETIVDLMGREVNVPETVNKIAAIAGPTYEMVFMLGSGDQIAMVKSGHTDSYPLANLTNPRLESMIGLAANPSSSVNIEDYLKHDIDLVVYYDNEIELKKFDAVDMPAVVVSKNTGLMESLEEAKSISIDEFVAKLTQPIDILSTALNTEEARAEYETWRNYCDEKLHMVYDRTKDIPAEQRKTVYWGNTWGEEIRSTYALKNRYFEVYLAGGQLIGPDENSNFPEVTAEQLYSWDPDIILVDNHGGLPGLVMQSMYREGSKWSTLSAVQNQQLHRIPAGVFFLDKGTTTTLLVLWMATILQPELFADIDMVEEVKYYYSEFYEFELTDEQAQNVIDGWVIDD